MSDAAPRVACFRGTQVAAHLPALARLRIAVFHDYPYLYEGDPSYEESYVAAYARSSDSLFVLAFDGDAIVGAATGLPLADEEDAFRQPFAGQGIDAGEVFYFGESVLLPEYRGRGIGHRFFDEREAHARALGRFRWTAFAAVDREAGDPRRPGAHRDNDAFWHARGYRRQTGMTMHLSWREIGEAGESEKPLTFWLRPLEAAP